MYMYVHSYMYIFCQEPMISNKRRTRELDRSKTMDSRNVEGTEIERERDKRLVLDQWIMLYKCRV